MKTKEISVTMSQKVNMGDYESRLISFTETRTIEESDTPTEVTVNLKMLAEQLKRKLEDEIKSVKEKK